MAARFERRTVLGVIVNFAVEDDAERIIFVRHRLMPRAYIHDAQATMTESDCAVYEQAAIVRPAMRDDIAHPHEFARFHTPFARVSRICNSVNSAHTFLMPSIR
jgi:hypothetical protein